MTTDIDSIEQVQSLLTDTDQVSVSLEDITARLQKLIFKLLGVRSEQSANDRLYALAVLNKSLPPAMRGNSLGVQHLEQNFLRFCVQEKVNFNSMAAIVTKKKSSSFGKSGNDALYALIDFYRGVFVRFDRWKETPQATALPPPEPDGFAEEEEEVARACGALPEISQAIRDRAFSIYAGLTVRADDGEPYRPSNGTEGEIFATNWCEKCERDLNHNCPILLESLMGQADEWMYVGGKPVCNAWVERTSKPAPPEPLPKAPTKPQPPKVVEFRAPRNTLTYPESTFSFTTPITEYEGLRYWVEGEPNEKRFYINVVGREVVTDVYASVIAANTAARLLIDEGNDTYEE